MADAREKINAELQNIERVLADLPGPDSLKRLSSLELAGVAALIHNFYNGVENVFKQLVISKGLGIPQGPSWHIDLLETCIAISDYGRDAEKVFEFSAFLQSRILV